MEASSSELALAAKFFAALGAGTSTLEMLHPASRFLALNKRIEGAEAVAQELQLSMYSGLTWLDPVVVDGQVRSEGKPASAAAVRGMIATLGFSGETIALVQRQFTVGTRSDPKPLVLPVSLKRMIDEALVEQHPILVAHVGLDGQPVLSFRGSVQAFGDNQLALWVRNANGGFIQAIEHNPRVSMMYRNQASKATYQLQGRARVTQGVDERRRIYDGSAEAERHHDFARAGVAVIVDLDRIEGYAGLGQSGPVEPVNMVRTP